MAEGVEGVERDEVEAGGGKNESDQHQKALILPLGGLFPLKKQPARRLQRHWPHLSFEIKADSRFEVAFAVSGGRSSDGGAHVIQKFPSIVFQGKKSEKHLA